MNWQPIETAPEGVEVLVWSDIDGMSVADREGVNWNAIAGWAVFDGDGGWAQVRDLSPTHWMPLPEPPK